MHSLNAACDRIPPVDSLLHILTRCNLAEPPEVVRLTQLGNRLQTAGSRVKSHSRTPEGLEFIFESRLGPAPPTGIFSPFSLKKCVHGVVFAASSLDQLAVETVAGHCGASKPNLLLTTS